MYEPAEQASAADVTAVALDESATYNVGGDLTVEGLDLVPIGNDNASLAYGCGWKKFVPGAAVTGFILSKVLLIAAAASTGSGMPVAWVMWGSFAASQLAFVALLDEALGMQECMHPPT